jgi:hypothetical protein
MLRPHLAGTTRLAIVVLGGALKARYSRLRRGRGRDLDQRGIDDLVLCLGKVVTALL